MRIVLILSVLLNLLSPSKVVAADAEKSNEQRVREYVAAYNKQDVDAMMRMVSDEIQWLNVAGDKITVETQGKQQLRSSLVAYFKSTPGTRSELEWVQAAGSRICARERAFWKTKSGEKSQASISIYEFQNGLIARVYYYPAEK